MSKRSPKKHQWNRPSTKQIWQIWTRTFNFLRVRAYIQHVKRPKEHKTNSTFIWRNKSQLHHIVETITSDRRHLDSPSTYQHSYTFSSITLDSWDKRSRSTQILYELCRGSDCVTLKMNRVFIAVCHSLFFGFITSHGNQHLSSTIFLIPIVKSINIVK